MNQFAIWNLAAVLIAALAFVATQLTSRRNDRAELLASQIEILEKDIQHKLEHIKSLLAQCDQLTKENLLLFRKVARLESDEEKK